MAHWYGKHGHLRRPCQTLLHILIQIGVEWFSVLNLNLINITATGFIFRISKKIRGCSKLV